jgi:hypothetical protein
MIIDVPRVVRYCSKHKITFEQFMLLYIVYLYNHEKQTGEHIFPTLKEDVNSVSIFLVQYNDSVRRWTPNDIRGLVDKDLLIDNSPGKDSYPDWMETTVAFNSFVSSLDGQKFEDLWDLYPGFVSNFTDPRAPKIPLKATDKDEMRALFLKRISSIEEYDELMRVTAWAKSHGQITTNFKNWLAGEVWKDMAKEMEETSSTGSVVL